MEAKTYNKQRNRKYIISGAELEHLIFDYLKEMKKLKNGGHPAIWGTVKNFLKLKQEVKLVAGGKMIIPFESEGFLIDGEFIGEIFHEKFGDKSIEHIEIYIQKENK